MMIVTVLSKRIKPLRFNSLADVTVVCDREVVKVEHVCHTQQLVQCAVPKHAPCVCSAGLRALTTHGIDLSLIHI